MTETEPLDPELAEEQANEHLSDTFSDAPTIVGTAAWHVGNRLLQAFHDELTAAGVRQSDGTKNVLSRAERRIKTEVLKGYQEIVTGGSPSVAAKLQKVTFADNKIVGNLVIDKNTEERHELADFAGRDVLIVLADDIGAHLAGMEAMVEELSEMQIELGLEVPPADQWPADIKPADQPLEFNIIQGELSDDEVKKMADAMLEDIESNPVQKLKDVPEERHIIEDGKVVAIAPDSNCSLCKGDGGWDMKVPDPDGGEEPVEEWVRCDCVEFEVSS